ncbi:hypothetical protein SAMN05421730_101713 [Anaerobium acetethylicum]|uniref:Uncharacterized protein n=1 Tax=Anaerobium acetethylicum TaxID=1619234 RepID=A0A1D3TVF3_9FIRM|nr:hypothetical protein SAMN05421730_101713 [Anaerobium acetethylicum]
MLDSNYAITFSLTESQNKIVRNHWSGFLLAVFFA